MSLAYFHDEAAAHAMLEEIVWPHGPECPKCGGLDRITRVKGGRVGLHRYGPCKRQFTVKVGTGFEPNHVLLNQWLQVVYMLYDARQQEGGKQPSGHADLRGGFGMTIEADDTYIGGKAANWAYGPIPPKQAVASLVERGGKVRSFHVPNVTANNLYPIVARHTHADSRFMTDETNVYAAFSATIRMRERGNQDENW